MCCKLTQLSKYSFNLFSFFPYFPKLNSIFLYVKNVNTKMNEILFWHFTFFMCTTSHFFSSKYSIKANVRLYVRMSTTFRGNAIFLAPNWDIAPIFFVQIPLINDHLFCKYFIHLSVGNATKGFATYGRFHHCF